LQALLHKKFGFIEKISRQLAAGDSYCSLRYFCSVLPLSGAFFFLKITSLLKK